MEKNKMEKTLIEKKQSRFKSWKSGKKWLYGTTALAVLTGVGITESCILQPTQVSASIVNGTQIGTVNNKPVIKANSNDMASPSFQGTVDGLLQDVNLGNMKYIADNIGWQSNTSLHSGQALSSFGTAAAYTLRSDGFQNSDLAIHVNLNEVFYVNNVGTVKDLNTGQNISVSLKVKHNGFEHGADGQTNQDLIFGVRNEGGTITFGAVTPVGGTASGGGQTENGGNAGGAIGDGSMVGYINKVFTTVTLVRSDNGQEIPNNELLVAMKVSDVDANQLAEVGANGALGYIVSPDTALQVSGNGLRSNSSGAVITDSPLLTPNSYVVLKGFNSSLVDFTYLDGANDHMDIVWALFGKLHFKVNLTGTFKLDKSLVGFGDNLPNKLYNFDPIVFDIYDKDGKDVGDIAIPANGSAVESLKLPPATYTLKERASSVTASTGQTYNPQTYTVKVEAGKTGATASVVKVDNKAVLGGIIITKTGVESGSEMWNENYTLEGNEFKVTSVTDGKVYTGKTDKKGKLSFKDLPLGSYDILETKASNGFVNTFKPVRVTLTWQDNKTEFVFDEAKGTNQEIKGENELFKADKETGAQAQGKAELKTAEYGLFYAEDLTGSSSHKKGDSVKWSDVPNAKLISGEKVTQSVINGKVVKHGENVVVGVDDKKLNVYVGNLPIAKYVWKELNAPVGYAPDSSEIPFEIKKKDDSTQTIITPQTKSLEQVIKAKISIQKLVEIVGESAESGFNDIQFLIKPLKGTIADPQTMTTGIKGDEDGHASAVLIYGDYVITEINTPAGYKPIKPIYIHMTTDPKTDVITITASYHEDGSEPFSKRTFSQGDNQIDKNTNVTGSLAGVISDSSPFLSLSKITLTDKAKAPVPSIDIEKTNGEITKNGIGNYEDSVNNLGEHDHDTKATAFEVTGDSTQIFFKVTNNGEDDLTNLKVIDKTTIGTKQVKDIKFTYKGKALTADKFGVLFLDGQALVLDVGETIEGTGTLEKLVGGEDHADSVEVVALGLESRREVGDEDEWHGHKPKPSIDIEKTNVEITKGGNGNGKDKPNNISLGDHDTKATAFEISGDSTKIFFKATNNGEDDLTNLKALDKTITGTKQVKAIQWTYKGKALTVDKSGIFLLDGKVFVLKVGETIEATGTLEKLIGGETHADKVEIVGVGIKSQETVGDNDEWHGHKPKPSIDIEKTNSEIVKGGAGNHKDKANNLGKDDHDTKETALAVLNDSPKIFFKLTNNGEDDLTNLTAVDKTLDGTKQVKDIQWTYKGKALTVDKSGIFYLDGKVFVLKVGETLEATGMLEKLDEGETHADKITVAGVGVKSNEKVGDDDEWHGFKPKPSVDVEKSSEAISKGGLGNHLDKPDNLGKGDSDTEQTAVELGDKAQTINFRVTNNGTESLTHIKLTDKTLDGHHDVKGIKWTYKGKALTTNKDGELELDDKLLELPVGGYIDGTGRLETITAGELHSDEMTVSAKGTISGKTVGDKDKWYGKKPKPVNPVVKLFLPKTGEGKALLATVIGGLIVAIVAIIKHKVIFKALRGGKDKSKK
ncbi:hypothetical protein RyT2_07890 [Pseudolactococcus yaeyamensis]